MRFLNPNKNLILQMAVVFVYIGHLTTSQSNHAGLASKLYVASTLLARSLVHSTSISQQRAEYCELYRRVDPVQPLNHSTFICDKANVIPTNISSAPWHMSCCTATNTRVIQNGYSTQLHLAKYIIVRLNWCMILDCLFSMILHNNYWT